MEYHRKYRSSNFDLIKQNLFNNTVISRNIEGLISPELSHHIHSEVTMKLVPILLTDSVANAKALEKLNR